MLGSQGSKQSCAGMNIQSVFWVRYEQHSLKKENRVLPVHVHPGLGPEDEQDPKGSEHWAPGVEGSWPAWGQAFPHMLPEHLLCSRPWSGTGAAETNVRHSVAKVRNITSQSAKCQKTAAQGDLRERLSQAKWVRKASGRRWHLSGGLNTAGVTCHCSELLPFALLLWPLLQKEVGGGLPWYLGCPTLLSPAG